MKELNIKNITLEEFKSLYNIKDENKAVSHPVSELGTLMAKGEDKVYYLIGDKLFEEPVLDINKDEVSAEDKETIERLHDEFRDSLVDYRDYLYYRNGKENTEEAKSIQINMGKAVKNARAIVSKYNIKDEEEIKLMSSKFFIPDFLNAVLGTETFNDAYDIDCGA